MFVTFGVDIRTGFDPVRLLVIEYVLKIDEVQPNYLSFSAFRFEFCYRI